MNPVVSQFAIEHIHGAIKSLNIALSIIAKEKGKRSEPDYAEGEDNPVAEAARIASSHAFPTQLEQVLHSCIRHLAIELVSIDGVKLDLDGAKIALGPLVEQGVQGQFSRTPHKGPVIRGLPPGF